MCLLPMGGSDADCVDCRVNTEHVRKGPFFQCKLLFSNCNIEKKKKKKSQINHFDRSRLLGPFGGIKISVVTVACPCFSPTSIANILLPHIRSLRSAWLRIAVAPAFDESKGIVFCMIPLLFFEFSWVFLALLHSALEGSRLF